MNEPSVVRTGIWRIRLRNLLRAFLKALPFAGGVAAAFLAILVYNLLVPPPKPLTKNDVSNTVSQVLASATPAPAFSSLVYQVIQPSLVLILSKFPDNNGKSDSGLGSGVIIDDQGDILTSLHVVAEATSIQLTFADGTKSDAVMTSSEPQNDIAVLRAANPPANLAPATLGNPNAVQVGDDAYVVGNPLGLYSSMSAGVISGLHRSFQPPNSGQRLTNMFQFDAAVNPGNSGGPLLNREGQVIGIVTGIVNPTGQDVFIGIGFAVPIDVAGGGLGLPQY
jgi:S1-C subfamily serine protease